MGTASLRKDMLKLAMVLLLALGLGAAAVSAERAYADEIVYWSSSSSAKSYHSSSSCAVKNSANLRSGTIAQAKAAGKYDPCDKCRPGTGSSGSSSNGDASVSAGWQQNSSGWWYRYSDGSYPADRWARIGGSWYLFDGAGYMRTGWASVGGAWYHLDGSGAMQTGWQRIGGDWYYLNPGGDMAEGWKSLGGTWYYLTPGSGAMATGWQRVEGAWYHLDGSGAMQTGWQRIGGSWYYLNPGGDMAEGWKSVGGAWYYLAPESGAMATGWQLVGGAWYHMDGSGAMQTGWQRIGGDWYYLDDYGAMASSKWVGDYYVDASGRMVTDRWVDGYYVGSDGAWIPNYPKPEPPQPSQSSYGKALDQWVATYITAGMTDMQKVEAIQNFTSYQCTYSPSYSTGKALLERRQGDCVAGANFLVDVCTKLGIRAEVRFAGDDAEKYHINYGAAANHHNAFVWIDGVQYVADANPGTYTPMFLWEPDAWQAAYDLASGKIPIANGPKNQDPTEFDTVIDGQSYLSGYNIALGLTKQQFTVTNDGAEQNYPPRFHMVAYEHTFTSVTSSDDSVIQPSPYNEVGDEYVSATILKKGSAVITATLDDGSVWEFAVTVK